MRYREKLIFLLAVIILVVAMQLLLPGNPELVRLYSQYVFRPYQSLRNILFGSLPVSIGDLLYTVGFIILLLVIVRWVYFVVRFRTYRHHLWHSLIHTGTAIGVLYVLFFIGWGGNYYKPSLSEYWKLDMNTTESRHFLFAYDAWLVTQLNKLAPEYQGLRFREVDKRAQQYFRKYTDSRTRMHGINAKASIFGYFMQYFGIQGYYNPFTGEAQVNRFQPAFMLPFVVCHEMAHQSGVAAEDDANLLAYALGTVVPDPDFRYSAYFNLWLYTHSRVRALDSVRAAAHRDRLNPISLAHVDTLRDIRRRYKSDVGAYSGFLYDGYLRLHNQKEGIRSYNNVVETAWLFELRRKHTAAGLISIP